MKGKITFSKKTIDKLKNKVSEHNKKGKGSKATSNVKRYTEGVLVIHPCPR